MSDSAKLLEVLKSKPLPKEAVISATEAYFMANPNPLKDDESDYNQWISPAFIPTIEEKSEKTAPRATRDSIEASFEMKSENSASSVDSYHSAFKSKSNSGSAFGLLVCGTSVDPKLNARMPGSKLSKSENKND